MLIQPRIKVLETMRRLACVFLVLLLVQALDAAAANLLAEAEVLASVHGKPPPPRGLRAAIKSLSFFSRFAANMSKSRFEGRRLDCDYRDPDKTDMCPPVVDPLPSDEEEVQSATNVPATGGLSSDRPSGVRFAEDERNLTTIGPVQAELHTNMCLEDPDHNVCRPHLGNDPMNGEKVVEEETIVLPRSPVVLYDSFGPAALVAEMHYPPVHVISLEHRAVFFSVSQVWLPRKLGYMAVDFASPLTGERDCDVFERIPPGPVGFYPATCSNGFASVTVYVKDDGFAKELHDDDVTAMNLVTVPDRCESFTTGKGIVAYNVSIDCSTTPLQRELFSMSRFPTCKDNRDEQDEIPIALEDFDSEDEDTLMTWLYGAAHLSDKLGRYLGGAPGRSEDSEVAKTYPIPFGSQGIRVQFQVYELRSSTAVTIRLQDTHFLLGFFGNTRAEEKKEFLGDDIWMELSSMTDSESVVSLIVPQGWFNETNHFTLSFKAGYGIDNVRIDALCNATLPGYPERVGEPKSLDPSPVMKSMLTAKGGPKAHRTGECTQNVLYHASGAVTANYAPVTIIAYEGETAVTFSLNQVWLQGKLSKIATDYLSPVLGKNCENYKNAPPGPFGFYTAVCVNGYATVRMFVHDPIFGEDNVVDEVPDQCAPLEAGSETVEYTLNIACLGPGKRMCERPTQTLACNSKRPIVIAYEGFEAANSNASWLYGQRHTSEEFGAYLGADVDDDGDIEIAKTFQVPLGTHAIRLDFSIYELQTVKELVVRIQDTYFVLGSFDVNVRDERRGFLGDVWLSVLPESPTFDFVTLIVPEAWFSITSHFTVAFKHFTVGFLSGYGVDDVKVTAICDSSLSTTEIINFS